MTGAPGGDAVSPALRVLAAPDDPPWRLVVCPHAGGSASYYRCLVTASWAAGAAPSTGPAGPLEGAPEIVAVQYPGRESRFGEPLAPTMAELLADVAGPVHALLSDDVPTALLGHSLGASVALRIATAPGPTAVSTSGRAPAPDLLVLAGRGAHADPAGGADPAGRAAQSDPARASSDTEEASPAVGHETLPPGPPRDDAALRTWLDALGGTPRALLDDDELFALHARILRADLSVHDSLTDPPSGSPPGPPDRGIGVPLLLLAGRDDVVSPPAAVAGWARRARAGVRSHGADGGHFFYDRCASEVVDVVRAALADALAGGGTPWRARRARPSSVVTAARTAGDGPGEHSASAAR